MVDTRDLKSLEGNFVRVRLPPAAQYLQFCVMYNKLHKEQGIIEYGGVAVLVSNNTLGKKIIIETI